LQSYTAAFHGSGLAETVSTSDGSRVVEGLGARVERFVALDALQTLEMPSLAVRSKFGLGDGAGLGATGADGLASEPGGTQTLGHGGRHLGIAIAPAKERRGGYFLE